MISLDVIVKYPSEPFFMVPPIVVVFHRCRCHLWKKAYLYGDDGTSNITRLVRDVK